MKTRIIGSGVCIPEITKKPANVQICRFYRVLKTFSLFSTGYFQDAKNVEVDLPGQFWTLSLKI